MEDKGKKNSEQIKSLYKELQERMDVLVSKEQSHCNDSRISELQLTIVRVQQILLDALNN